MNQITASLLEDYAKLHELPKDEELGSKFEKFSAYSVIRKIYGQEFDTELVEIGGGLDTGIDSIGILVNGVLVNTIEEINDLKERNNYLDVTYILIQSKISESFETDKIATFCRGVEDFFLDNIGLKCNDEILAKKDLHKEIMKHAVDLLKNPKLALYYVCTGHWKDEYTDQKSVIDTTVNKLRDASLFSNISYKLYGADEINSLYKETRSNLSVQIEFESKATLPKGIPNVQSAYIGILPFSEFKKLIVDDDGYVRGVFEDNIRDFQDFSNPVNQKINETLAGESYKQFPLLNNGVTIVSQQIQELGNTMVLRGYQIVNGCQTSNVLARYIEEERLSNLSIPVKIIVTSDDATKNCITLATNSQTPVKREQLAASSQFQKNLEDYYNSQDMGVKLVYERRTNQYASSEVPKTRIITVPNQIKAFASMFLRRPHRVTSYYGELIKNLGKTDAEIFNPEHQQLTYYLAGLTLYRLESLFRSGGIDTSNKKLRFFILMVFLLSIVPEKFDRNDLMNSKQNAKKLQPLVNVLSNAERTNKLLQDAVKQILQTISPINKEMLKIGSTTDSLVALFND